MDFAEPAAGNGGRMIWMDEQAMNENSETRIPNPNGELHPRFCRANELPD